MNIAIIEPLSIPPARVEAFRERFTALGHTVTYADTRTTDPVELARRAAGAEIVVIANCPFPAQVVESLPDLRLLAIAFTGVDHVDLSACRSRHVAVCNASGYSTVSVAELTIGMILDLLRHVTVLDPITRSGGTREGRVGRDLAGKTVGVVGTGAIGSRVAKNLLALDCTVLASSRTQKDDLVNVGVRYVDLPELASESDIVTLHCPLNDETRGLWSAELFKRMKPGSLMVNCARGPVIDTPALIHALKTGPMAAAALDVFDGEPPLATDNPLLALDNVLVTPHIAFATEEAFDRRADIVEENIEAWLAGNPRNLVS